MKESTFECLKTGKQITCKSCYLCLYFAGIAGSTIICDYDERDELMEC